MFKVPSHRVWHIALMVCFSVTAASQDVVYVQTTGDDSNPGTEAEPFRTITRAVEYGDENGSTIARIKPGVYDQDHEAGAGGFPIQIRSSDLVLEAYGEDPPLIGGDITDQDVRGFLEVDTTVTGSDLTGVVFRNLTFAGQDLTGLDAPSAVFVQSRDGEVARVTVDSCVVLRSEMNGSAGDERPSIKAIAGRPFTTNNEDDTLELQVVGCRIEANDRGGVVADLGTDCHTEWGRLNITVQDNVFALAEDQGADAAIDIFLEGFDPGVSGPLNGFADFSIRGNTIDSSAGASAITRFKYGILIGADVRYDGGVAMPHAETSIQNNVIRGCDLAAIAFVGEIAIDSAYPDSQANMQCWNVDHNTIVDNVGDGILIDGGSSGAALYLRVYARNSLIADNGGSGLHVVDMLGEGLSAGTGLLWCTISGNARYGIELSLSSGAAYMQYIQNSIVWDNDLGSSVGFTPCGVQSFHHNDWQLSESLACVAIGCQDDPERGYNISVDPEFFAPWDGDYHLDATSCCIDRGVNSAIEMQSQEIRLDIDGEARRADGDGSGTATADMGADERPADP